MSTTGLCATVAGSQVASPGVASCSQAAPRYTILGPNSDTRADKILHPSILGRTLGNATFSAGGSRALSRHLQALGAGRAVPLPEAF